MPTFIDLFAGAGGFSEGFLQAEYDGQYYDFLLASDINNTCEVTHRMRYNRQLGLSTEFLTKDIMDSNFIETLSSILKQRYGEIRVDVVVGGPPCQSFSLAGERRTNDKKDDLFTYYLKVIEALKPKYFVMENVEGILTKDEGRIKERILRDIKNIVDYDHLGTLYDFIVNPEHKDNFIGSLELQYVTEKIDVLLQQHKALVARRADYISILDKTSGNDYSESERSFLLNAIHAEKNCIENKALGLFVDKIAERFVAAFRNNSVIPEDDRNVVRQALNMLKMQGELESISTKLKLLASECHLNRSPYKQRFDEMTEFLGAEEVIKICNRSIQSISSRITDPKTLSVLSNTKLAIEILSEDAMCTVHRVPRLLSPEASESFQGRLNDLITETQLYRIDEPIILNASDYGVPQNRYRVAFIGCRNDQPVIRQIPKTVSDDSRVTVEEAIGDLGFIGIGRKATEYDQEYYQRHSEAPAGSTLRTLEGKKHPGTATPDPSIKSYVDWSRSGRLNPKRFKVGPAVYTPANSMDEIVDSELETVELANHETANHTLRVQERYALIRKYRDYTVAREKEPDNPLITGTSKRNYAYLHPDKPSTTMLTIGDDFAHYGSNRCLTVREMARLQSFDDSFVFQGKRTTGGNRRRYEIPQYTQVGNAVPPLLAHAIALEILRNIR